MIDFFCAVRNGINDLQISQTPKGQDPEVFLTLPILGLATE